ncbi:MAG: SPFH domain-containing protein [Candidatus Woesearchaeota archaeon]
MTDDEKPDSRLTAIAASAGRISKRWIRAGAIGGVILGLGFAVTNAFTDWVYQVRTNYGVIITQPMGERIAVEEVGWHFRMPFVTKYEGDYPTANQMVFLHGNPDPHEVITKGGKVIMAAGNTNYEIVGLKQFAVENVRRQKSTSDAFGEAATHHQTPEEMVQRTLDSIIGSYIQKTEADKLIHDRDSAEKEVLESMLKFDFKARYGVQINSYNFTHTNYIPSVVEANGRKQTEVALAEGKRAAAVEDKQRIETLASADGNKYKILAEALEKAYPPKTDADRKSLQALFERIVKYGAIERSGGSVWVLPQGEDVGPVFNPSDMPRKY